MIKKLIIGALLLVFIGVFLLLGQMWFTFLSSETFMKSLITLGVLIGVDIIVILVLYHLREETEYRKDDFIN